MAAACAQLLEEYDVGEDQLQADLAALIGRLAEAGLLTVTFPAENGASAAAPSAADLPPARKQRLMFNRMLNPTRRAPRA